MNKRQVDKSRLAMAVKWYEKRMISQARAAEFAEVSRSEFLTSLTRFGVTPFQYESANELLQELADIPIDEEPL